MEIWIKALPLALIVAALSVYNFVKLYRNADAERRKKLTIIYASLFVVSIVLFLGISMPMRHPGITQQPVEEWRYDNFPFLQGDLNEAP